MKRVPLVVGILLVLALALWIGRVAAPGQAERQPMPMPLILERVQALGELHTARHTYQNVFEHTSSRRPETWVRYVPGAASLVTASTRNRALVGATAQVEAGVDLSKARVTEGRLVLPRARVYPASVDANVIRHRPGLLWHDPNLGLKASRAMQERVEAAAVQKGILAQAERTAAEQLRALVPELATYEIVFE